jgi:lipopolysaccharide export system permease protein
MRLPVFKRVDRLVAMAVLGSVALTWAVLVGLDAFRTFVGELDEVGQGNYTLTRAAIYVLLTVPRRFYEMFGYAALIGGLLGLGGLAASGELTALRAAGLSRLRICASVALALGALTAGVAVLGETVGPWGEHRAQALALAARSDDVALASGVLWAREGQTVIGARHGRQNAGGIALDGVRVFEFDAEGRLLSLAVAAQAVHGASGWVLRDVRRTVFGEDSASSTHAGEMRWASALDPGLLASSIVKPQYLGLGDLGQNIAALERSGQDASGFRQQFWARLLYPVDVLVLVFCALPFAFGALRSGGLAKRLFLGIVLALGFYFLQRAVVSLGVVFDVHPALANLAPPLLLVAGASLWFRRHA